MIDRECELREVDIEEISLNPYQPRKEFCPQKLRELACSIKSAGLLQPPLVRQSTGKEAKYELVSGERRLKAAQLAGLSKITVIVSRGSHKAEEALIENIQRTDLNALEIAENLKKLLLECGYSREELAEKIGKPRSTIANYLRLLSLPSQGQRYLRSGEISLGHAKAILSLHDPEKQLYLAQLTAEKKISVRECEKQAKKLNKGTRGKLFRDNNAKNIYIENIQERLQDKLGTKVSITGNGALGKIEIEYYGLDDLDRLLNLLI